MSATVGLPCIYCKKETIVHVYSKKGIDLLVLFTSCSECQKIFASMIPMAAPKACRVVELDLEIIAASDGQKIYEHVMCKMNQLLQDPEAILYMHLESLRELTFSFVVRYEDDLSEAHSPVFDVESIIAAAKDAQELRALENILGASEEELDA